MYNTTNCKLIVIKFELLDTTKCLINKLNYRTLEANFYIMHFIGKYKTKLKPEIIVHDYNIAMMKILSRVIMNITFIKIKALSHFVLISSTVIVLLKLLDSFSFFKGFGIAHPFPKAFNFSNFAKF